MQGTVESHPVLVVDDDAAIRELIRVLLNVEGVPVAVASNGREALRQLEGGLRPRLILLDYMMPEMNGGELLELLRSNTQWTTIPVYLFTAFDESKVPHDVHLLKKPVDYDELLSLVRRTGAQ